jgi:transcriptional regulator with XRE-family HTH domain
MASAQQHPFGGLLRRYRLAADLTQEELAERAGISVDAISALERGLARAPHKDTLDLLAEALQLSGPASAEFAAAARRRAAPSEPLAPPA